ncbi:MAG: nucleoside phosphorylase [Candidatus Bathyarchaeota archaeon]|nr:MAG: nucleoside phosphorylase [Candidatus Bathyarchaeota archaeon]
MKRREYPILEYDSTREAIIEPRKVVNPIDIAERCVICFYQDVIDDAVKERGAKQVATLRSEIGRHPIYEINFEGDRLAFFHPGVGAPLAAGLLEEVIALGCRKFIACGSAGVLRSDIAVGHIVIPHSAIRDEGTSYHYQPPAREVQASLEAVSAIERVMKRQKIPYIIGKTWTNDAFYRETPSKIGLRREEGCLTVEMEAAALFAVARFRQVVLGQILCGGDDVSGEEWDARPGVERAPVREKVFWLAAEACLEL